MNIRSRLDNIEKTAGANKQLCTVIVYQGVILHITTSRPQATESRFTYAA